MQASNDAQIRSMLIPYVRAQYQQPDTLILEEFALLGGAIRADLAVLNGVSHGFEIKSDRDTLSRLPNQADAYSSIFDRVTLVSTSRHLKSAEMLIPRWWGLIEYSSPAEDEERLELIRECQPNPNLDGIAIANLLWRPEAIRLLEHLGLDHGVRSKPMEVLAERLAATVRVDKLSRHVREALRARGDWRSAARLKQCGGRLQRLSNRWSYQRTPYGNISR